MYLLSLEAQESVGPRVSPVRVLDQLNLIDYGHIVRVLHVGHLDSASQVGRVVVDLSLLPRDQTAGDPVVRKGL